MRKKSAYIKVLPIVLFMAAAVFFSGCEKSSKDAPVEITLMHGWGGTLQTCKTMEEIYDGFALENPDIKLNCVPYSQCDIVVEKGTDMLAVGKMPDIIGTSGLSSYVKNAVKVDKAMDLMPYIEKDSKWKRNISPSVFDTWVTGSNSMYTLPDVMEVAGYWYNEESFKQAGIVNQDGGAALPQTWTEFMSTVERLQNWIDETGQSSSVFAMEDAQMIEFLFLARLAGEGENGLAAADNPYVRIQTETLEHTLSDLKAISRASKWVDKVENARQSFYDGTSIIYFNGVWESDVLKDSPIKDQLQYTNYPTSEGKSLAYISPSSGYVLAKQEDEKKAEAEIRFLKYMLSDEVQTKIAIETGQAPTNPNIDREQVIQGYPMFGKAIDKAYNAEIQLKTIFSIWPEEKINIVKKYLNPKELESVQTEDMLAELNADCS